MPHEQHFSMKFDTERQLILTEQCRNFRMLGLWNMLKNIMLMLKENRFFQLKLLVTKYSDLVCIKGSEKLLLQSCRNFLIKCEVELFTYFAILRCHVSWNLYEYYQKRTKCHKILIMMLLVHLNLSLHTSIIYKTRNITRQLQNPEILSINEIFQPHFYVG